MELRWHNGLSAEGWGTARQAEGMGSTKALGVVLGEERASVAAGEGLGEVGRGLAA